MSASTRRRASEVEASEDLRALQERMAELEGRLAAHMEERLADQERQRAAEREEGDAKGHSKVSLCRGLVIRRVSSFAPANP